MNEREKIIRFYKSSGDGELAARLLDLAELVLRGRKYRVSDFLDPHGAMIAETIVAHYDRLKLEAFGGYMGAERTKAAFVDREFLGKPDFHLAAFHLGWDPRYYQLSHRDVLGALMGLGMKRECLGDIIMTATGCQLIVDDSMAEYVRTQLAMIGPAPVTAEPLDLNELQPKEERVKEIRSTVPSLRLDVVAAAGFGLSRTRMSEEIDADKLKVNWQDAKNCAQAVKAGDILSMRGRGRVEVQEILGQTKKGRISILLKRFM